MKKRFLLVLVAVLAVFLFAGCDWAVGGEYEVEIINQTTGSYNFFDVLNITDAGQSTWERITRQTAILSGKTGPLPSRPAR